MTTRLYITDYALTKSRIYEVEATIEDGIARVTDRLGSPEFVGDWLHVTRVFFTLEDARADVTRQYSAKIAEITKRYKKSCGITEALEVSEDVPHV